MSTGRGDGPPDPFELDPFGDDDYDPSLAFASVARTQTHEKIRDADRLTTAFLPSTADGLIGASARKSTLTQLEQLRALGETVDVALHKASDQTVSSQENQAAQALCLETYHRAVAAYNELAFTVAQLATTTPVREDPPAAGLPELQNPQDGSRHLRGRLKTWIDSQRGTESGNLCVLNSTPGIGKTHEMIELAHHEQMDRHQRVVFAVRTKEMLLGEQPELVQRVHSTSPLGRVHLNVIVGRGPENCYRWETVSVVQAHGYAPGRAVCLRCEHHPQNARTAGFAVCGYYEERIRAHNHSRGAKVGYHQQFPLILTTHASLISAYETGGGQWGSFWGANLILIDEDCTDAMESEIALTEAQSKFRSKQPRHRATATVALLLQRAIELGRVERRAAVANAFIAPGSAERNSHAVHSRYDSVYAGADLHELLTRAHASISQTSQAPPLMGLLRDLVESESFEVGVGELAAASSVQTLNMLEIPPVSLSTVANAVLGEMHHRMAVERVLYEKVRGKPAIGQTAEEVRTELRAHTALDDFSYITRLECAPTDLAKDRAADEWRFVVREYRPFTNTTSHLVIGDAYAQPAHYEHLFARKATTIEVVATLQNESRLLRILDDSCTINALRTGGLQRVLALVEHLMTGVVRPGDRVLIYGHQELRAMVENWLDGIADRLGLGAWAYEHWWGGRGKDQYNGWEHTYTISDPVQSLSGITHVANARAYRDATGTKDIDNKIDHSRRVQLKSTKYGTVHSLRTSHWRLALEHDRVNVAELTQATHRTRPVHHAVSITMFGEMEQSRDFIAQTSTVMPAEYRRAKFSNARRSSAERPLQVAGVIDAFSTREEITRAIRATIDWFGVWSPWFAHSLLTGFATLTNTDQAKSTETTTEGVKSVVLKGSLFKTTDLTPPGQADIADASNICLEDPDCPRTLIQRIWDPPVYWELLNARGTLPKPVKEAMSEITSSPGLCVVDTERWPTWMTGKNARGGGRRPRIVFDPNLIGMRPDVALKLYYEIVDCQYGYVAEGRLVRPTVIANLPGSLRAVPF